MIGTLANAGAIVVGSLLGGFFQRAMRQEVNRKLLDVMGLAAFGLGINAVVQNMPKSQYPVLFIISLALGCVAGTLLKLDERVGRLSAKAAGGGKLAQGLITGCLIFCVGTLSILGPVRSALYGDHTLLFTNASLDLVTSMVLASAYGPGIALAAVVLTAWQGSIYLLTRLAGEVITQSMMTELSIVGGFLIAMSGLAIMEIKAFKPLDYLPALLVPVLWCLWRG